MNINNIFHDLNYQKLKYQYINFTNKLTIKHF